VTVATAATAAMQQAVALTAVQAVQAVQAATQVYFHTSKSLTLITYSLNPELTTTY
jgi:hypothetical protein